MVFASSHAAVRLIACVVLALTWHGGAAAAEHLHWNRRGGEHAAPLQWTNRHSHRVVALSTGELILMGGQRTGTDMLQFKGDDYQLFDDVWFSVDGGVVWSRHPGGAPWGYRSDFGTAVLRGGGANESIIVAGGMKPHTYTGFNAAFLDTKTRATAPVDNEVWQSTDGGRLWTLLAAQAPWAARRGFGMVALSSTSLVIFGGVAAFIGSKTTPTVAVDGVPAPICFNPPWFNDVWRSDNGGVDWYEVRGEVPDDGTSIWLKRQDSSHAYLRTVDRIVVAAGELVPEAGFILPSSGGQGAPGLALALAANDVWASDDQGATWTQLVQNAAWPKRHSASLVAVELGDSEALILMGGMFANAFYLDIWRSDDYGASWRAIAVTPSHTLEPFADNRNGYVIPFKLRTVRLSRGLRDASMRQNRMRFSLTVAPSRAEFIVTGGVDAMDGKNTLAQTGLLSREAFYNRIGRNDSWAASYGCPAGGFSTAPSWSVTQPTGCVSCPRGSWSSTGGIITAMQCANCSIGRYSMLMNLTAHSQCTECEAGRYNTRARWNITACDACVGNTYSTAVGASSSAVCVQCPRHHFSPIGASSRCDCVTAEANTKCIAGERVIGTTMCEKCEGGKFSAKGNTALCTPCAIGTFTNVTGQSACKKCSQNQVQSLEGKAYCRECGVGQIPDAAQVTCVLCADGMYKDGFACRKCPTRGAQCSAGILKFNAHVWYVQPAIGAVKEIIIDERTEVHDCFNTAACRSLQSNTRVECASDLGYGGPLCGACVTGTDARYIRAGRACSQCGDQRLNIALAVLLSASVIIGLVYIGACRSMHRRVGEYGSILRRVAFSYIQMLGVLGIFKARGTRVFDEVMGKSAAIAGGGGSQMLAIKCLMGSEVYGPFLLNMALPPLSGLFIACVMVPTALVKHARGKCRERKLEKRREKWKRAFDAEGTDAGALKRVSLRTGFVVPSFEPVVDFGSRCGRVPTKLMLRCKPCRKTPTEEYMINELRRHRGQPRMAPRMRPWLSINYRFLFGYPHALLLACKCCSVPRSEEEQGAWRAEEAVRMQRPAFAAGQRLAAVLVLVLYSLYPTLVASTASIFQCSDEIDGKQYLVADFTIECYSGMHLAALCGAAISFIVYCVGVPLAFAMLTIIDFCNCECCAKPTFEQVDEEGEMGDEGIDLALEDGERMPTKAAQPTKCIRCICICKLRSDYPWGYRVTAIRERLGLLLVGYDTTRGALVMAWEPLIVMFRKLLITLVGSLPRDPYLQIMLALTILVASLTLQALVQPYESNLLNVLDVVSLLVLVLTQVLSILYLYFDTNGDQLPYNIDAKSLEFVMTLLLFLANGGVICMLFAVWICRLGYEKLGGVVKRKLQEAREDSGRVARLETELTTISPPGAFSPPGVNALNPLRSSGGESGRLSPTSALREENISLKQQLATVSAQWKATRNAVVKSVRNLSGGGSVAPEAPSASEYNEAVDAPVAMTPRERKRKKRREAGRARRRKRDLLKAAAAADLETAVAADAQTETVRATKSLNLNAARPRSRRI